MDDEFSSGFDLQRAAFRFFRDFPERKADTLFFDSAKSQPLLRQDVWTTLSARSGTHLPGEVIENILQHRGPGVFTLVAENGEWHSRQPEDAGKNSLSLAFIPGGQYEGGTFRQTLLRDYFLKNASTMAYYRSKEFVLPDAPGFESDEYWLQQVFDHECGHILFKHSAAALALYKLRDTVEAQHFDECTADAYSLIRHYQKYGTDTGFDRALILSRARLAGDMRTLYARRHMTVPALEAIAAMDKDMLMALSPQESFDLAVKTAHEHALSKDLIEKFAAAAGDTAALAVPQMAKAYAGSDLPPVLVGDFLQATLAMQKHDGLTAASLAGAIARLTHA